MQHAFTKLYLSVETLIHTFSTETYLPLEYKLSSIQSFGDNIKLERFEGSKADAEIKC